jgi:hypothetical protein
MALEIQVGKAVLWGIGDGSASITGIGGFILQDGKIDHKFKMAAVEDEVDSDAALIATNEHVEATMTWTPLKGDGTAPTILPTPLQKITTSNFVAADLNGDWYYVGDASINLSHAAAKMSLKLRRYIGNDNL